MDWNDARFFLAVMRAGSLSAAAKALRCSHSTVRRRLQSLEQNVGVDLFVAAHDGLTPTALATESLARAEALEQAALSFERALSGGSTELQGRLRITTVDALSEWLAPALVEYARLHPGVQLELCTENRLLDLSRGEAEVAVRVSNSPSPSLFGRRVGRLEFAPFASRVLLERSEALGERLPWLLYTEDQGAVLTERWYAEFEDGRTPLLRVSSAAALLALVRAGVGAALLPDFMEGGPELVRLRPRLDGLGVDLWCLTHFDLRHTARVRAFMEVLASTASGAFSEG
ncbi:MAG: LysR family transcriptional regulator [Myxococcota bacterium]